MKNRAATIRFAGTLFGILVCTLSLAAPDGPAPSDVTLYDAYARPFSLSSFKGKIVVLDFWAPWCAPCRKSFPFLDGLRSRYADKGLEVVGLTLESDVEAVRAYLDTVPAHFPVGSDPTEHAGEAFGVVAMPTTLLLDRDGRVVARFEGGNARAHRKLEAAVRTLLDGGTLPPDTDVLVSKSLDAKGGLRAWQRGYLADPIMSLDGDALTRVQHDHVYASKEGAVGDGGAAGGGCGCN
ncbi:MAG: redoxin family protein [Acidobacteriia bacterium]|nr:redoxin family protein [Terriglobia bacterium]